MAKIDPKEGFFGGNSGRRFRTVTWADVGIGDEVGPFNLVANDCECLGYQVEGEFSGGRCAFNGSIDRKNWRPLLDSGGIGIRHGSPGVGSLSASAGMVLIRPAVSGDAKTKLTITILARGAA